MEFRILGPLEVRDGGEPLTVGGVRQRTLLALLLLNANRPVSTDRLVAGLWGDEEPATALGALQNYVSQLLAKLGLQRRTQAAVLAARHRTGEGKRPKRPDSLGP